MDSSPFGLRWWPASRRARPGGWQAPALGASPRSDRAQLVRGLHLSRLQSPHQLLWASQCPTGRGAQARDRQNGAGRGSMPLKTDAALSRSRPRHAHSTPLGTGSSGKPLAHGLTPRLTDRYGGVGGGLGVPWVSVLGGAHCSRTGRKDKIFRRRGCKHPARSRLPQSLGTLQSRLGGGQS